MSKSKGKSSITFSGNTINYLSLGDHAQSTIIVNGNHTTRSTIVIDQVLEDDKTYAGRNIGPSIPASSPIPIPVPIPTRSSRSNTTLQTIIINGDNTQVINGDDFYIIHGDNYGAITSGSGTIIIHGKNCSSIARRIGQVIIHRGNYGAINCSNENVIVHGNNYGVCTFN